jgi:long-subunit acyl-CoA synthetase (AMP-forming)
MRNLLTLANITGAMAALALMAACQTTGSTQAVAQKETLLAQSGFRVVTVKNPKQQQAVNGLAQNRCSAVKYNGKLYYVYPTSTKDRIYVGKQAQFNTYKKALAAQQAQQASWSAQQQQEMLHGSPAIVGETAGPHHIEVEEFQGSGFTPFDDMGD